MPGILPMKVIKIGSSAQSRIAQACDRCRSKKIRCDGVRPCCSQCATVGFECKTSDKLSRRAFPRGYTESLEERVRALEAEVRELKDLLDEKDEKIDMISRIHSSSPHSLRNGSPWPASSASPKERRASSNLLDQLKEETFKVQASPLLVEAEQGDAYYTGASSGRTFVESFKRKLQESEKTSLNFSVDALFADAPETRSRTPLQKIVSSQPPPRLLSDQYVNIFFQEWAPLFPVLHRPAFLAHYQAYVVNPEETESAHVLAQLSLVFGIAALSNSYRSKYDAISLESQWQRALDTVLMDNNLSTLQCLVLAQIYCVAKGDYAKLLHYKGIAIGLSHRLGLHQSQKRFSLDVLSLETRKKTFWALYTLDCFSATMLGLPQMLNDDDVHAELPADVDDEYITEKGFQPSLPGEATKISSALALFRVARILSRVLAQEYPAASSHEISLTTISDLSDELDQWENELAPHLKLQFDQDKPSTKVTSSRSPLLSLAYFYIRSLIHRPAVGSSLGQKASSSVVALADSCKHIIQIVQLLEERNMSFSFCLNRNEMLMLSGFGLLFQGLQLSQEGKLIKDNQRLICSVVQYLNLGSAPGAAEFKKVSCSIMAAAKSPKSGSRRSSEASSSNGSKTAPRRLQTLAARPPQPSNSSQTPPIDTSRRATVPKVQRPQLGKLPNVSHLSISSTRSEPSGLLPPHPASKSRRTAPSLQVDTPNLDYLPFDSDSDAQPTNSSLAVRSEKGGLSDWESLLGSSQLSETDLQQYGLVSSVDTVSNFRDMSFSGPSTDTNSWSPDTWEPVPPSAHSVISYSEESLGSGDDYNSKDALRSSHESYRGIMMPSCLENDAFGLDSLEETFGL